MSTEESVRVRSDSAPLNPLKPSSVLSAVNPEPPSPLPTPRMKLPCSCPEAAAPSSVAPENANWPCGAETLKLPAAPLILPSDDVAPATSTIAPLPRLTLPRSAIREICPPAATAFVTTKLSEEPAALVTEPAPRYRLPFVASSVTRPAGTSTTPFCAIELPWIDSAPPRGADATGALLDPARSMVTAPEVVIDWLEPLSAVSAAPCRVSGTGALLLPTRLNLPVPCP